MDFTNNGGGTKAIYRSDTGAIPEPMWYLFETGVYSGFGVTVLGQVIARADDNQDRGCCLMAQRHFIVDLRGISPDCAGRSLNSDVAVRGYVPWFPRPFGKAALPFRIVPAH